MYLKGNEKETALRNAHVLVGLRISGFYESLSWIS